MVDLTIELLKQIRDGVQTNNARIDQTRTELSARIDQTNARLDETNARLGQTNARLDQTRTEFMERLDQTNARIDQTNARIEKVDVRLKGVEGQVGEAVGLIRILADRDERLAVDVADLRRRVEALESSASR